MRVISLSIDYIQASSGHSPEARAPDSDWASEEAKEETEKGPMFMYGERIVSRKKRRFQRPHSAVDRSTNGVDQDSMADECETTERPKSSPCKPRPKSAVTFQRLNSSFESDTDPSDGDTVSRPPSALDRLTPHQAWEGDTFDITKN